MFQLNQPSAHLKCKLRVGRMLYPRTGFTAGSFAIVACTVLEVYEGEPYADNIVIKGKLFSADYDSIYDFTGDYVSEEKYGESYKVISMSESYDMNSQQDQMLYLQNIMTPKQFDLITAAHPDAFTLCVNKNVDAIASVKGIGKNRAEIIIQRFHDKLSQAKAYTSLSQYGLTIDAITSLLNYCPDVDKLLSMIEQNPYLMITEVRGIGWAKADALAQKLGIVGHDPRRVDAYVVHFLQSRAENGGHTWCEPQALWDAVSFDLRVDDPTILQNSLYRLHDSEVLWWPEDRSKIALRRLREIEYQIAQELCRIASGELLQATDADSEIALIEQNQGWAFTDEQMSAVRGLLSHNVNIITGYAGTGKSSVVSAAVKVLGDHSFAQCALSGRAAARLTEVTGKEGMTIHRLLGFMNGYFMHNKDNPLPEDIIILDEISMVGAELFLDLVQAIPTGTKLIMLGDDGQLESIGLCNIFKDMLDCGVIPVYRLTQIHRQAAKSAIITESIKVRSGLQLCDDKWIGTENRGELRDLDLCVYSDKILTHDYIMEHYRNLLDQGISHHQIQVIVPMKTRGAACTHKINIAIQELVNQDNIHTQVIVGQSSDTQYSLRRGDRVICTKNMYRATRPNPVYNEYGDEEDDICPIYNGDRGVVKIIDADRMIVTFDQWGDIAIPRKDYCYIELGYALSCHKLQGSEAEYIIIGFDMSSMVLLTREWVYTAITRAKKHCIISAESKALQYAISNTNIPYKQTFLRELLQAAFGEQSIDA